MNRIGSSFSVTNAGLNSSDATKSVPGERRTLRRFGSSAPPTQVKRQNMTTEITKREVGVEDFNMGENLLNSRC